MALSPRTIRVTNDEIVNRLFQTGQSLIDMGMRLQGGFDVPVEYTKNEENE